MDDSAVSIRQFSIGVTIAAPMLSVLLFWLTSFKDEDKKGRPLFADCDKRAVCFLYSAHKMGIYQFSEIKVSGCEKTKLIFFLGFTNNINVLGSFVPICVVMISER